MEEIKPGEILAIFINGNLFKVGDGNVKSIDLLHEIYMFEGPGYFIETTDEEFFIVDPANVSDVVYSDLSFVSYLGIGEEN